MRSLEGQTAIVTGAGSGIGRGVAGVLAAEGADVVAVDLDAERLTAVAAGLDPERTLTVVGDVADAADVARMAAAALEWKGRIDVLVSNVGIYPTSPLESMLESEWNRVMAVNVGGAFLLLREVLPTMRSQAYGRVVVISSITGTITAMPTLAHYAASKAALLGLVRTAALEVAGAGVTVNAVLPGTVETEGLRAAGGEEYVDLMLPSIPVGRLATPEDLAWAVRMLVAAEAGYITGTALPVDGGQTLPEGRVSNEAIAELIGGSN